MVIDKKLLLNLISVALDNYEKENKVEEDASEVVEEQPKEEVIAETTTEEIKEEIKEEETPTTEVVEEVKEEEKEQIAESDLEKLAKLLDKFRNI